MISYLLLMMLVLSVSIGNLALGYGLAIHMGQGPASGWRALMFWKKAAASLAEHGHEAAPAAHVEHAAAAPAHH